VTDDIPPDPRASEAGPSGPAVAAELKLRPPDQDDPRPNEATALLLAWNAGDAAALDRLMPLVHAELRRLARRLMTGERAGQTLQPTAVVHEAFLRLVNLKQIRWQNRAHFLAMAARLMRRVLVDAARARKSRKRGGGDAAITLDVTLIGAPEPARDVVALHEALTALASLDPRSAQVVELRFFGGLTNEEAAAVLDVSTDTIMRDWKLAKTWLLRELTPGRLPRPHPSE
jgi:RNA polymerase sigma factor (TIGR02999 family)